MDIWDILVRAGSAALLAAATWLVAYAGPKVSSWLASLAEKHRGDVAYTALYTFFQTAVIAAEQQLGGGNGAQKRALVEAWAQAHFPQLGKDDLDRWIEWSVGNMNGVGQFAQTLPTPSGGNVSVTAVAASSDAPPTPPADKQSGTVAKP